ncbi:MAG: ATP-binding protein [Actinobacteria bacterium]|nr:ATP-binding protein [Actinomycetota bacterium]
MREIVLRGEPASTNEARSFVATFLEGCGVPEDDVFEILVAVTEAVGNAIRHSAAQPDDRITVRCQLKGSNVVLQVQDDGCGFSYSDKMAELPDPISSCGRGFFLMNELMDHVEIDSSSSGTTVLLQRKFLSHALTA